MTTRRHYQFHDVRRNPQPVDGLYAKRELRLETTRRPCETVANYRSLWVETHVTPEWRAAYRLVPQKDGQPVIAELRVFPSEAVPEHVRAEYEPGLRPPGEWSASVVGSRAIVPAGGLTARLLRQVRMGQDSGYMQALMKGTSLGQMAAEYGITLTRTPRPDNEQPPSGGPRRGRPPKPDLVYARLARDYVAACERSTQPVLDLAARSKLPAQRVRDMLHTARNRGLLGGLRSRGARGGILTEKAAAVLEVARKPRLQRKRRTR
jgi:hypothetical protein